MHTPATTTRPCVRAAATAVSSRPGLPTHSTTTSNGPDSASAAGSTRAVAPKSAAARRRRAAGSDTVTVPAPRRRHHAAVVNPTGPAPMTSTSSPGSMAARRAVCRPTANGSTSGPYAAGRASGRWNERSAPTRASSAKPPGAPPRPMRAAPAQWATSPARHHRHVPQDRTGSTAARIPSAQSSPAPAPTATTSPQNSWPMTVPAGMIGRALRSEPQIPQPVTCRTSSPGPGVGSPTVSTANPLSGPTTAARIIASLARWPGGRRARSIVGHPRAQDTSIPLGPSSAPAGGPSCRW